MKLQNIKNIRKFSTILGFISFASKTILSEAFFGHSNRLAELQELTMEEMKKYLQNIEFNPYVDVVKIGIDAKCSFNASNAVSDAFNLYASYVNDELNNINIQYSRIRLFGIEAPEKIKIEESLLSEFSSLLVKRNENSPNLESMVNMNLEEKLILHHDFKNYLSGFGWGVIGGVMGFCLGEALNYGITKIQKYRKEIAFKKAEKERKTIKNQKNLKKYLNSVIKQTDGDVKRLIREYNSKRQRQNQSVRRFRDNQLEFVQAPRREFTPTQQAVPRIQIDMAQTKNIRRIGEIINRNKIGELKQGDLLRHKEEKMLQKELLELVLQDKKVLHEISRKKDMKLGKGSNIDMVSYKVQEVLSNNNTRDIILIEIPGIFELDEECRAGLENGISVIPSTSSGINGLKFHNKIRDVAYLKHLSEEKRIKFKKLDTGEEDKQIIYMACCELSSKKKYDKDIKRMKKIYKKPRGGEYSKASQEITRRDNMSQRGKSR